MSVVDQLDLTLKISYASNLLIELKLFKEKKNQQEMFFVFFRNMRATITGTPRNYDEQNNQINVYSD
jgi:hypothetical protein